MIRRDHRKASEVVRNPKALPHYGRDDKRQRLSCDRLRNKNDSRPLFTLNKLKATTESFEQRTNYHETFQEQIELYRRGLQKDLSRKLDHSKNELNEQLDTVISDFEKQCNVIEAAIYPLQQSFKLERVAICSADQQKEFVVLENQMGEFSKIKAEKYNALVSLWKEYEEVQAQLIKCAVAILGEGEIKLIEQDISGKGTYEERDGQANQPHRTLELDHAHQKHTGLEQSYINALASFDDIEVQLNNLTHSALKDNKVLLQSFRTSREKQIDELKGFLETMGML